MAADNQDSEKNTDEDILALARDRFREAEDAWKDIYRLGIEDLKFSAGEQWPAEIKNDRDRDGRPTLTINRLPQFIRQVTNDQRQNRPSIKVHPVDDNADVETAKILQGMVRHIETDSNADVAYDTSFDGAVRKSFGFWRLTTEYVDPHSFEQEVKIKSISNHFSVLLDPNSVEPDGSDAEYGFIFEDLTKAQFKSQFPKAQLTVGGTEWETFESVMPDWIKKDGARVAEYFYKDYLPIKIALLSNGHTADKAKLTEEMLAGAGIEIVEERDSHECVVRHLKICGNEILEQTDWPGRWIPIVPCYGEILDIGGTRVLESLVRHAKDPQRMYNYWASAETETIALAPRAPFIGAEGQFEGHEHEWKNANRRNYAYLEYRQVDVNGAPAPPPQRQVFEAPIMAISQARAQSADDLKATTGIYDAALGNRSNENSGVAIQRRNMQAQTSNFHFVDNLARSQRHTGRMLLDLIPKVYDTARAQRIIGEEGDQQIVTLNELFKKDGEQKSYMLSAGKYDAVCETGPSYATKRQEAVATMIELTKSYPQLFSIVGDLMLKSMDVPGATEMAERLKKTLPPGIAEPDDKDQKPIPPQVQAQMAQMGQMIEQLTKEVQGQADIIDNKRIELESRERIEMAKIQANIEIEAAKLGSKEAIEMLHQEVAQIEQRLSLLNFNQPIDSENEGAGPEQAFAPEEQQPTGGLTPGEQSMGQ